VSALCTSVCIAGDWTFKKAEEDWGETCFAETRINGVGNLGVMGAKGGDLVAYINSEKVEIPSSSAFQFRFNDGPPFGVTGGINDYFGHFELDASTKIIDLLSNGKTLAISGSGFKSAEVSLAGSGASIKKVRQCLN
jgi:hypothetical protein